MTATRERVRRSGLGPTRREVLAELRSAGVALPVSAIATAIELRPNSVRFHLDALVERGLAIREDEPRDRPGRPRALYRAAPHRLSEAEALQGVARALVRHLGRLEGGSGEQAEAAGRMWGEELAAVAPGTPAIERVKSTLDALGYEPTQGESDEVIVLAPCPLRGLLEEAGPGGLPTVCRLHLGLMRGLVADDPSYTVTGLEPLVTPDTCIARIQHQPAKPA
jgi:predicted ArsR family transcriptional regulator